ncbi:MAG: peptidyl-prolyl cis-trans isomerase D [Candidatus Endobugula sp.]|jgi:peptidyl-prolyl cis-trans isomerase D
MLQSMRNKTKGLVAVFLIGLLTIPLALVGVENLFNGTSTVGEAAEVDGTVITERDVQLAISRERQRLQSQFGENLPADFFTDERLRESVMTSLVQRTLMINIAERGDMTFSTQEIDKTIVELPIFQLEGNFDQQRFLQSVRNLGHTPASFRTLLKNDLLANQMQGAIVSSDFITDKEIDQVVALSRQTRDFSWLTLPLENLPNTMTISEEEISIHYDSNKAQYLSTEEVAIEYIELSVTAIEKDITIDNVAIQQQYDEIVASYDATTQREASHIMIEGDDEAAQQKIAVVKEKLASGIDFAELASEYSDDFGTRDNGGNLGLSTGEGFPEAFEEALLLLTEGQVSEAVSIDNATHFIKLIALTEKQAPTFDSQKAKIESELKRNQAEEQFVLDVQTLEELAYNAENLEEVAGELGVTAIKTSLFTRDNASTKDAAILQDRRVIDAAFSEQVVQEKHSSDMLNISSDKAVVVKLLEHNPVRTLTLEEKREEILAELQLKKAKEKVAEQAQLLREALNNGTDISTLAEEEGVVLSAQTDAQRNAAGVPEELLASVFKMPHPKEKAVLLERHLDNGDYIIASLSKVSLGNTEELTVEERVSLRTSLSSGIAGDEYRAWQAQLESNADVEIYRSRNSSVY